MLLKIYNYQHILYYGLQQGLFLSRRNFSSESEYCNIQTQLFTAFWALTI